MENVLRQTFAPCNFCKKSFPYRDLKSHEDNCTERPVLTKTNQEDGSRSKGQWNGKEQLHGIGEIIFANGDFFEGEFKDGDANGHGKMTYANGDIFEGEYKDGEANGPCKWTFANGDIFEGEYKDSKRNGPGKYTYANGDIFEGEYKDGEQNGPGKIYICKWYCFRRGVQRRGTKWTR
jgi:hypothetical protein